MENEQKTAEASTTETTAQNNDGGIQQETEDPIARASAILEGLKETEKRIDEKVQLLNRQIASAILSGKSGMSKPPMTEKEEAEEIAKGIGDKYFKR